MVDLVNKLEEEVLEGYKNLVGTINQPAFVLCDPEVLKTLSRSELKNGFAEVVKQALARNAAVDIVQEGAALQVKAVAGAVKG